MKESDYIVAVGDTDCKWLGLTEVMRLLKDVNEEGIEIQVVSMLDNNPPVVRLTIDVLRYILAVLIP